ncbi:hypothetical protein ScalyP_jg10761 [Parmales sp. scaly parma]|nr:hypothetical protein ScalyP_jg10761 [Parmales sp. scaly parma]
MGLQRSLILIAASAASLLAQSSPECVSCVDDCLEGGCDSPGTDCYWSMVCILECAIDALTTTTCETSDLTTLASCSFADTESESEDCLFGAIEITDAECGVCLTGLEIGYFGFAIDGQIPCMEPTNFEGCESIDEVLPLVNATNIFEAIAALPDACAQCALAFTLYYGDFDWEPDDEFVSEFTDFCIDGIGPPDDDIEILMERKLKHESSNVCSGTDTDLKTVSLTIFEIAFSDFPTEAIVPPAPTAAPSAAPTVTTGTTTTGTTSTTGSTTTTSGTTATGTSSAVHLSIGSWTLLLAFAGIWV